GSQGRRMARRRRAAELALAAARTRGRTDRVRLVGHAPQPPQRGLSLLEERLLGCSIDSELVIAARNRIMKSAAPNRLPAGIGADTTGKLAQDCRDESR